MSTFAFLAALALCTGPSASEVREELDARPWHPAPAGSVAAESTLSRPAAAAPAAASAPAATAPAASQTWQLQLAALQNADAAGAEKKRLEKILGPGTVEILVEGPTHRLRYGRFATKSDAEQARTSLKAKGIDGFPAVRPSTTAGEDDRRN